MKINISIDGYMNVHVECNVYVCVSIRLTSSTLDLRPNLNLNIILKLYLDLNFSLIKDDKDGIAAKEKATKEDEVAKAGKEKIEETTAKEKGVKYTAQEEIT